MQFFQHSSPEFWQFSWMHEPRLCHCVALKLGFGSQKHDTLGGLKALQIILTRDSILEPDHYCLMLLEIS